MYFETTSAPAGRLFACAAVAVACAAFSTDATASVMTFDDQTILVTEEFGGIIATSQEVPVGDGVEIEGVGFLNIDINIGASSIALLANATIPPGGGLFGFGFADVDMTVSPIVSVAVGSQSGFAGLGAANLGITENGNKIVVNFGGVAIDQGDSLLLEVTFEDPSPDGVIPLPATLPLALGGLAAFAALGRRRGA